MSMPNHIQIRGKHILKNCSPGSVIYVEEKATTLTSRASDSDLEYLGASESPPLKRKL